MKIKLITEVNIVRGIVIGYGVQGKKREFSCKDEIVAIVDNLNKNANYKSITDVPLNSYDFAFVCVPDEEKPDILFYLANNGKHALVEKPLIFNKTHQIE